VQNPQVNAEVIFKNIVPEIVGLGSKKYYLEEVTYDFIEKKYAYVVDTPEETFETLLAKGK